MSGMLWFDDNTKTTLQSKIEKAVEYFKKKYNLTPNKILVHPNMLKDGSPEIEGMVIQSYRPVLPGHIWIGIEDVDKHIPSR